uniref:Uncharacterized protein n=1 Tax=Anopheles dirus TaxID=7168 RepID=A0A182NW33_9DIPT
MAHTQAQNTPTRARALLRCSQNASLAGLSRRNLSAILSLFCVESGRNSRHTLNHHDTDRKSAL